MNDMFNLNGKNIVITGAAGLLGNEYALAILDQGGNPILIDINLKALNIQKKKLDKIYNTNLLVMKVDITKEKQVKACKKKIVNKFKKIDGLINNAALNPKVENNKKNNFSRLEKFKLENWNKEIDIGLKGSFLCAKYIGTEIAKNPNGGSIINISSDLGLISPDQRLYKKKGVKKNNQPVKPITYSVIKSGLVGLTKYLATYWPEQNVRCNVVCPGGVKSGQSREFLEKVSNLIPLNRLANKNEFNSTIVYLLSDSSQYVNGAIISIDGGRTIW